MEKPLSPYSSPSAQSGSNYIDSSSVWSPEVATGQYQRMLLDEIRSLREELRIRPVIAPDVKEQLPETPTLKISLDRAVGERKPFVLRCHGVFDFEQKLSSMRAALLLALLIDLHDRSAGGGSFGDMLSRMIQIYRALDGTTASDEQVASLIRVGLYRLELSLVDGPLFIGKQLKLVFNPQQHRFEIDPTSIIQQIRHVSISISSSDPKILSSIDTVSNTSPLCRARQQKSMYISSSERGWDQLFLEFFDHKRSVRNTSLFYRPGLASFPEEVLRAMNASSAAIRRRAVAMDGLLSKRVELNDIITRRTLWDMVTMRQSGGFKLYPAGVTTELVLSHLRELRRMVQEVDGYRFGLTDAAFPFIVGVVELGKPEEKDSFTLFYRNPESQSEMNCFVLYDPLVCENVLSRVISTVRAHPSTVVERRALVSELSHVIQHVDTHGPLIESEMDRSFSQEITLE